MATATAGSPVPIISSPPLPLLLISSPPRAASNSASYKHHQWRTPPSSPLGLALANNSLAEGVNKNEAKDKKAVKSGSRAAPIPEGAIVGFRSAREVAEGTELESESRAMATYKQKSAEADETKIESKPKPKQRRRRSDGSKLRLDKKPVKKPVQRRTVDKQSSTALKLEPSREMSQTFKMPSGFKESEETSRYFTKVSEDGPHIEKHGVLDDSPPAVLCEAATTRLNTNLGLVPRIASPQVQVKPLTELPKSDGDETPIIKKSREKKTTPTKKKPAVRKQVVTITAKAIANIKIPMCAEDEVQASPETSSPRGLEAFSIAQVHKPHIPKDTISKPAALTSGAADGGVPKRKRSTTKVKKAAPVEHKLRSPESAMRRFQRQDFLFGTSSQLFSGEDPGSIRELQLALKASELESDVKKPRENAIADCSTNLPRASRKLWLAGAQGDGEEFAALQKPAPKSPETLHEPLNTADSFQGLSKGENSTMGRIDLTEQQSGSGSDPGQTSQRLLTKKSGSRLRLSSAPAEKKKLLCLGAPKTQPRFSSHATVSQILSSHIASQAKHMSTKSDTAADDQTEPKTKPQENPEPEPEPQTKPKPRKRSKATETTAVDSQPPAKRPRGRPRKDTTAAPSPPCKPAKKRKKVGDGNGVAEGSVAQPDEQGFVPIDEIEDEDPPTPSPPRRHSPSVVAQLDLSGPLAIAQTVPEMAEALAESHRVAAAEALAEAESRAQAQARAEAQAEARKKLFAQITKAIKSAPRTTDPKHPSWWEKMLLYDPIVIEDLTAWLNDGALEATGVPLFTDSVAATAMAEDEDARTDSCKWALPLKPAVVQKWCEANSVCCLWREGLRGGVKTKY